MKKKKIANELLDYFSGMTHEKELSSKESLFVQEATREAADSAKITPPLNIWNNIISEHSARLREKKGSWIDFLLRPVLIQTSVVTLLVIFVFAAIINLYLRRTGEQSFDQIVQGNSLSKTGLAIRSEKSGQIALLTGKNSENIFLKSGSWEVTTEHNKFKKDTWFYYPGGGLKPIGTRFRIQIDGDKTHIELIEGKIQTFSIDEKGKVITSRISRSPFQESFMGTLPATPEEAEKAVAQSDSFIENVEKNRLPKPVVKKGESVQKVEIAPDYSSVYRLFIGSRITVKDKNGRKISGVLKSTNDGNLVIRNKDEILFIDEKEMTLVDLEVHPDQLLYENKK